MSTSATLRLGTRGSELALTQSTTIANALRAEGFDVELSIIRTAGDRANAVPFNAIGPPGVFVREIEQALSAHNVDLAVHSFKDLPTASPAELIVAAVPARYDCADLLLVRRSALARNESDWLPLKSSARVGTASARRRVWLQHFRPDLTIESLRGNVPTRIRKLQEGTYDAIVLAAAGVERLRADDRLGDALRGLEIVRLDPERFVPAPAQGALAIQCRRDDRRVLDALGALDHAASHIAVAAERDALARAEGGCDIAFGAYCISDGTNHELIAMHEHAGRVRIAHVNGADPLALAAQLWPDFALSKRSSQSEPTP